MGLPVARLGLLSAVAVLLLRGGCAGSSHSLRIFYTLFMGSDQDAPQYIVVGYVDDQLASRFDPPTRRMLPQVPWLHNVRKEDLHFWDFISQRVSSTEWRFKSDLAILHRYYNTSKGFHSWQRMIGCGLSEDGHKQGHFQYGYDGDNFISLDQKTLTWTAADVRAQVTKRRWEAEPFITQNTNNFLEKECIQLLQKCMMYGTESLLRKAFVSNLGLIAGIIGVVVAAALIAAGVTVYIKKRSRNAYRTALTTSQNIEIPRVN